MIVLVIWPIYEHYPEIILVTNQWLFWLFDLIMNYSGSPLYSVIYSALHLDSAINSNNDFPLDSVPYAVAKYLSPSYIYISNADYYSSKISKHAHIIFTFHTIPMNTLSSTILIMPFSYNTNELLINALYPQYPMNVLFL